MRHTTYERAYDNLQALIQEIGLSDPPIEVLPPRGDPRDERDPSEFRFHLRRGDREVDVWMAGLPLAELRRGWCLYVDGNSWTWKYAIEIARDALNQSDGEK